jgi:hypothetical protein
MCTGTGDNMCYESGTDGTCSVTPCYDPNNWIGYQDWAWSVASAAVNDSYVFTSLTGAGVNRVCKTDLGATGANIFYLSDWPSGCSAGSNGHWQGLEVMSSPVVSLAADTAYVWWSVATATPRLIETDMCGSNAGDMCEFSDQSGTGSLSGYGNWKGRQDWCSGYSAGSVTSWNCVDRGIHSTIETSIMIGSGAWRIVTATSGSGMNMVTGDCTGTTYTSGSWMGYQDFNY